MLVNAYIAHQGDEHTSMINTASRQRNQTDLKISVKATVAQLANRLCPDCPQAYRIGLPGSSSSILLEEDPDTSPEVPFPSDEFWTEVSRLRIRELILLGSPWPWKGLQAPPAGTVLCLESFSACGIHLPRCLWEGFSEHFSCLRSIEVGGLSQEDVAKMGLSSVQTLRHITIELGYFDTYIANPTPDIGSSVLEDLKLNYSDIERLNVQGCPGLKNLEVFCGNVTAVDGLSECVTLECLDLRDNPIKSLPPLPPSLKKVLLRGATIDVPTVLGNASSLELLYLESSTLHRLGDYKIPLSMKMLVIAEHPSGHVPEKELEDLLRLNPGFTSLRIERSDNSSLRRMNQRILESVEIIHPYLERLMERNVVYIRPL